MKKHWDISFRAFRLRIGYGLIFGRISKSNALQISLAKHTHATDTADYRFQMLCFSLVQNFKITAYTYDTRTLHGYHFRFGPLHFAYITNSLKHLVGVDE